jgi:hypothetical protein
VEVEEPHRLAVAYQVSGECDEGDVGEPVEDELGLASACERPEQGPAGIEELVDGGLGIRDRTAAHVAREVERDGLELSAWKVRGQGIRDLGRPDRAKGLCSQDDERTVGNLLFGDDVPFRGHRPGPKEPDRESRRGVCRILMPPYAVNLR